MDLHVIHFDENNRTLFDIYIRLFKKLYLEYYDNVFLIINTINDSRVINILELEPLDKYKYIFR